MVAAKHVDDIISLICYVFIDDLRLKYIRYFAKSIMNQSSVILVFVNGIGENNHRIGIIQNTYKPI